MQISPIGHKVRVTLTSIAILAAYALCYAQLVPLGLNLLFGVHSQLCSGGMSANTRVCGAALVVSRSTWIIVGLLLTPTLACTDNKAISTVLYALYFVLWTPYALVSVLFGSSGANTLWTGSLSWATLVVAGYIPSFLLNMVLRNAIRANRGESSECDQ